LACGFGYPDRREVRARTDGTADATHLVPPAATDLRGARVRGDEPGFAFPEHPEPIALTTADLDRARRFYRDRLGLEPVEEREGGLRYVCGTTEFHIFASSGAASGRSTQMGFEVEDIDEAVADLRAHGVEFESFDLGDLEVTDQIVTVPNNYPSKGTGERGAFFFDSEGNLLALGQATR
jgi:catechol 2,3-dioxygenase-like lactoylglutathione lyase family enzyme